MYGYGYYGATQTPAPVPYSKQTDQFLIGIINQYGSQLKTIAAKIEDPKVPAAEKTNLKAQQTSILTSYWNPAKAELTKRGYTITVTAAKEMQILSPSKTSLPSSIPATKASQIAVSTGTSSKAGITPAMIVLVLAAGAFWWLKNRKQPAQA